MAEDAQIDIKKGRKVIRIHSGWGTLDNVIPALRTAQAMGLNTPQKIAEKVVKLMDASFGLDIVTEDVDADLLSLRYTVDVASDPWMVTQTKSAGYPLIDTGDDSLHIGKDKIPARTRTFPLVTEKQIEDAILLLTNAGVIIWDREQAMANASLDFTLIDMRGNPEGPERVKFETFVIRRPLGDEQEEAYLGTDTNKELVTVVFGDDEENALRRAAAAAVGK